MAWVLAAALTFAMLAAWRPGPKAPSTTRGQGEPPRVSVRLLALARPDVGGSAMREQGSMAGRASAGRTQETRAEPQPTAPRSSRLRAVPSRGPAGVGPVAGRGGAPATEPDASARPAPTAAPTASTRPTPVDATPTTPSIPTAAAPTDLPASSPLRLDPSVLRRAAGARRGAVGTLADASGTELDTPVASVGERLAAGTARAVKPDCLAPNEGGSLLSLPVIAIQALRGKCK
jgi:hypothetical protein